MCAFFEGAIDKKGIWHVLWRLTKYGEMARKVLDHMVESKREVHTDTRIEVFNVDPGDPHKHVVSIKFMETREIPYVLCDCGWSA